MKANRSHFSASLAEDGVAVTAGLPYMMTYRIVSGPSNAAAAPVGLSFPSGRRAIASDLDLEPSIPERTRQWLSNSFTNSFCQKDGQLQLITLFYGPTGNWSQALRSAFHHQSEFPQASFDFRVSPRKAGTAPAQSGPEPIMQTSARPEILGGFHLTLGGPIQVLDIARTGVLERILFISRGGDLSGVVPADLSRSFYCSGI